MPLTVLRSVQSFSPADLVRLFHQSQLEWSRHLGEETELDFGRWISNPALRFSPEANCLLDAYLVPGISGTDLISQMESRSAAAGAPWLACTLNPSINDSQTAGISDALSAAGWTSGSIDIWNRNQLIDPAVLLRPDLSIIPVRASYRHYQQLMEDRAATEGGPLPEVSLLHLDDSRLDGLLALQAGKPIGCIGVLSSGEVGTVREWYVTPEHRQQGIGKLLFSRAMEICRRSLFKRILLGMASSDGPAKKICQQFGFGIVGQWVSYRRGSTL